MFQLFFSMVALAQEPTPAESAEAEEEKEPVVIETISVTGRIPTPEIQVVISRPKIPVLTTEELLEAVDDRLAEEEAKR